jgi:transposase
VTSREKPMAERPRRRYCGLGSYWHARHALARIDEIDAGIGRLSLVIERLLAPYEEQLQQAESMPGRGRRAAQDAIAETGVDMSRFPTPGHLASWAGRTPLDMQSGKRAGPARHKHGNRYLGAITGETAVAAGKSQTREGARHRRLSRKRGKAKACVATGNIQMRVYHALLSRSGGRHQDLGYEATLRKRPEPDGTSPTQPA